MKYIIALLLLALSAAQADYGVAKFVNPICEGADPSVVKNPDGPGYYYVYGGDKLWVEFALSPADFKGDRKNAVFSTIPGTICDHHVCAPELHRIKDKWYVYFGAADENNVYNMFVVSGDDPTRPFGNLKCMGNYGGCTAVDQTVFEYKRKLYTCYSVRDPEKPTYSQKLMFAEMASPWEIKDKRVDFVTAELDWEKSGWEIVEGPYALQRKGKLYIVYSGSGAQDDGYCLGVLTFKGGDIMNPANWEKRSTPILKGQGNMMATGHATFIKDADGNDWAVYHMNRPHTAENMRTWIPRYVCMQQVVWIDDFPTFSPVVEKPKYFKYEK